MDTLSRKHRLRQQARNQQEQQFYPKESRQFAAANDYHQLECARLSSIETNNNLNINNNNGMEEDEEQFRVFRLVEIGRRERREARDLVQHNNNNNNNLTHWREQENDDEVYLTHTLPRGAASTTTGGPVTKCNGQTTLGPKAPSSSIVYLGHSSESTSRQADLEQRTSGNSSSSLKFVYTAGSNGTSNFMDFSTGSTRSTGYGSGAFMSSEASSTAGGPPSSYRSPLQPVENNEHSRHAEQANSTLASHSTTSQRRRRPATGRSKVIDDLDRLLRSAPSATAPPGHSYSSSPTESYLSCSNACSKAGAHESNYSTLCRDEFSSFIKVAEGAGADAEPWRQAGRDVHNTTRASRQQVSKPGAGRGHAHPHRSGPMLVGVHESGQQQQRAGVRAPIVDISHASPASSPRSRESCSPPVEFSFTSRQRPDQRDHEEQFSEASDGSYLSDHSNSSNSAYPELVLLSSAGGGSENLSEMLDTYMERLDCLLRLAKGEHQNVSMEEAFGRSEREIEVSEEFRTAIEYAPLHRPRLARIVQEVVEAPLLGCESEEEKEESLTNCEPPNSGARPRLRVRTELASGREAIRALQWSVQTSAKLNWDHQIEDEGGQRGAAVGGSELRSQLEGALAARLMQDLEPGSGRQGEVLVSTVRRHLSDFIENYNAYQRELRANTSFANDWHTNWLFAYKRPTAEDGQREGSSEASCGVGSRAKRARMGADEEHRQIDLLRYSTLLVDKYTPVKLTYSARASAEPAGREIEGFYAAQEAQADELQWRARESSRQTDACRLLLCADMDDDDGGSDDGETDGKRKRQTRGREQPLRVNYGSSLAAAGDIFERQLRFPAYGYLLESPVVRVPPAGARWPRLGQRNGESKLRRLKLAILNRLRKVTLGEPAPSLPEGGEQVRFLVKLANVELINRLPVIQFCAKVSGPLPISVRWYRSSGEQGQEREGEEEISCLRTSVYGKVGPRKNLRVRERGAAMEATRARGEQEEIIEPWPIEMHANYDFEYQNEWSSWFRFRRRQGEILFEIREASAEHDYGRAYRCVIQNYCSRRECTFSLTARAEFNMETADGRADGKLRSKLVRRGKKEATGESGHALLRTWSQRTLHKPQPETREPLAAASELERLMLPMGGPGERQPQSQCADASAANCKSWQQTVGRRSAFTLDADKFGKDFPYHPENLLKRLEENKLTVKCKPALRTGNKLPEQQRPQNAMGNGTAAATRRSSPTASAATGERARLAPDFQRQSDEHEALEFGQRQLVLPNNSPQESQAAPEQEQQLELEQQQQESSLSGQQASNNDQAKEQPTRAPKPRSRLRAAAAFANQGGEPAGKPAGQVSSRSTDGQGKQQAQERQHCDGQLRPQAVPAVTVAKSDLRQKQQVQEACCSLGGVKLNNNNNTGTASETGQPQPSPTSGTRSEEVEWIPRANVKSLISRFS